MTSIRSMPNSRRRAESTCLCSWSRGPPRGSPRGVSRRASGTSGRASARFSGRASGRASARASARASGRLSGRPLARGVAWATGAGSCRRSRGAGSSLAAESGSAVVRSWPADSLAEESRRSHRGMSTPAQMATMATYSIALLNGPPLGVAAPGGPAADSTGLGCRHTAKTERAHVTQSNSWRRFKRVPGTVCRNIGPKTVGPKTIGPKTAVSPDRGQPALDPDASRMLRHRGIRPCGTSSAVSA